VRIPLAAEILTCSALDSLGIRLGCFQFASAPPRQSDPDSVPHNPTEETLPPPPPHAGLKAGQTPSLQAYTGFEASLTMWANPAGSEMASSARPCGQLPRWPASVHG